MDMSEIEESSPFELCTNGFCFNCYFKKGDKDDQADTTGAEEGSSGEASLKVLCQKLGLNLSNIFKEAGGIFPTVSDGESGGALASLERAQVTVTMCKDCKTDVEELSRLFNEMDKLQEVIDKRLSAFNKRSVEGKGKEELVSEYDKAMSKNLSSLIYSGFIDKLRETISGSCGTVKFIQANTVRDTSLALNPSSSSAPAPNLLQIKEEPKEPELNAPVASENLTPIPIDLDINASPPSEERAPRALKTAALEKLQTSKAPPTPSSQENQKGKQKSFRMLKRLFRFKKSSSSMEYKCRKCDKVFKNYEEALDHYENFTHKATNRKGGVRYVFDKDSSLFKCTFKGCATGFTSRNSARIHFKAVHLGIRMKCDVCKAEGFYDKATLNKHQRSKACKPLNESELDASSDGNSSTSSMD